MSRYDDYDDYGYPRYHSRRPRQVTGGIKAQGGKNLGGASWWAKRWVEVLERYAEEDYEISARLKRGRTYAKKGQVVALEIARGKVTAYVQGSRATPYKVLIRVDTLDRDEWQRVIGRFANQPLHVAKLLAGEMPAEVEAAFDEEGLPFFPYDYHELDVHCGCQDWVSPCKHIAAVLYLLGEEIDRDPFLIFKLRGMERDRLMKELGKIATGGKRRRSKADLSPVIDAAGDQTLSTDLERFWGGGKLPPLIPETSPPPVYKAGLLKQLGNFPTWRGEEPVFSTLEPLYAQAAAAAMDLLARQNKANGDETEPNE